MGFEEDVAALAAMHAEREAKSRRESEERHAHAMETLRGFVEFARTHGVPTVPVYAFRRTEVRGVFSRDLHHYHPPVDGWVFADLGQESLDRAVLTANVEIASNPDLTLVTPGSRLTAEGEKHLGLPVMGPFVVTRRLVPASADTYVRDQLVVRTREVAARFLGGWRPSPMHL
ncbi:hypothetical protein ARHIZOSPH14_27030 [Agromyces rhizosphaerae]|uniref:Uncharacterized protein n=1 Tax=Agromyces rhizosphaerae TaxID=88374 RepID=A0A9W6CYR7_9MICO|nr:hypothetical protein [Agromyces rhizosphaerae]GLI28461.1 hypothetical protein ARHIZOSPH14_27030 [Agromyces rhizosphaerae]